MPRLFLPCSLFAALSLFCLSTFAIASSDITPFNFKSEDGQAGFTLKKDLQPVIPEIELQIFQMRTKVFEVRVSSDQTLVWPQRSSIPAPGQNPEFGFMLGMKDQTGQWLYSYGYFYREAGKLTFALSNNRANLPGPMPLEFFKALTLKAPDNAAAWLFYGITLTYKHQANFVFFTTPPPPPPAAPPPPPPGVTVSVPVNIPQDTPEKLKRYAEEDRKRKADEAAMRQELIATALPAIRKAYELTKDCQTKDAAMLYLNRMASSLNRPEEAREWLLKRADSPCASKESVAESYYALGIEEWACAYQLSNKYRDQKAVDSFHFRRIADPADKLQFDNCLSKSAAYIEKALAADPNYADAMFYKSLIYREKQKTTADPVEHKKLGDEAAEITKRGMELQRNR